MTKPYAHNDRTPASGTTRNSREMPTRPQAENPYARDRYTTQESPSQRATSRTARAAKPRTHYNAREEAARYTAQNRPLQSHPRNEPAAYRDTSRYCNRTAPKKRPSFIKPLLTVGVAAVCAFGLWGFVQAQPITVTVNGLEHQLGGEKNLDTVFKESFASPNPGNLIAVDDSLLEEGEGHPFSASVNGEAVTDSKKPLPQGAIIEITDGGNITEEATSTEEVIPTQAIEQGVGAIHRVTQLGQDGTRSTLTGKVSGKTVTKETAQMQPRIYEKYAVDTQGDKVVALTFDDGPWPGSTEGILDVLKQNNAKATFFTVGERIEGEGVKLVKRAFDEGHQVCTHSFDHARGSGQSVNMSYMTTDEQVAEVAKGQEVIANATGAEANKVFRAPGGNFPLSVWQTIEPQITAEIGWNIDSGDWRQPGTERVASALTNVSPGDVILCHDGGGDRAQTLAALKTALPALTEQGYRFITIDELMEYPAKPLA
ncbi:MAG: polysaccharide deacetylase family protein [Raoultibacter sp.]